MKFLAYARAYRHRYHRLALVFAAAIALSGLPAAGVAHAATRTPLPGASQTAQGSMAGPDANFSCSGKDYSSSRHCFFYTYNEDAPVFNPEGTVGGILPPDNKVEVTCWYYGNPPPPYKSDGVQDHVVWTQHFDAITGHIPDAYINEGGLYPYDSPFDLAECG